MRINQRWFVWLVLALCVLAVPAAVLTQSVGSQNAEGKDSSGSSDGLMTRFKDHIQVVRLSGMIIDKADHSLFTSSVGSSSNALKELRKALKSKK